MEAVPDINYPIVHGKDNETYLHRTYEKNYNFAGTIFVDYENKGISVTVIRSCMAII